MRWSRMLPTTLHDITLYEEFSPTTVELIPAGDR